ncbi:hypothetical protein CAPTEDRAFT_220035 [Capitella teleta]|uniref:GPI transamidase component PIG-S n=1 Tax=Capitella teleta TaxID=283909 RepID=R7UWC7_CAPTE|nr:hypothetical protein CAPTEDRAFT_220035 [Capitella teleta]|eukprot:ELU07676.1 hypothetical protein CAPTEDRAFT_220035 [Capitella teleta]
MEGPKVSYRCNVRQYFNEEMLTYKEATTLSSFDDALEELKLLKENGKYTFVLIPEGEVVDPGDRGYIGRHRSAFLRSSKDLASLVSKISGVMREIFAAEKVIAKAWNTAVGAVHQQADKDSMRALQSQPNGYEITFTLLNPQPSHVRASWNIQEATKRYLSPLLSALHDYTNIKVKSQYLHSTNIGVRPKVDQVGGYALNIDQLPHIINPIEAFLGSHVSNNPNLNFILYIPLRDQSPLFIYNQNGEKVASNAFLSPRWGGFLVHNVRVEENASLPVDVQIDERPVMQVFAAQLRLLLGVSPLHHGLAVEEAPAGNAVITDWELDLWLRSHCLENLASSVATLNSLAQLLEKIGNIVINDDIGREVERAVEQIQISHTALSQGQLRDAYLSSRQAKQFSEKAFFDPSLLELLYFPEDQKFAIYIPLFLPIGIPVVMSVLQSLKYLRKKNKQKME